MNTKIEQYLNSKKNRWSETTIKSERSRLYSMERTFNMSPDETYKTLSGKLSRYSLLTAFVRKADFLKFFNDLSHSNYIESNRNLFKNSYTKEKIDITFNGALMSINSLKDEAVKTRALAILYSGQRWSESCQIAKDGLIMGKGAKLRPDFRPPELGTPDTSLSYFKFYRELKKIGLKPHTLRKLALQKMVDKGAKEADLLEVAGWSSFATAASYLQPKREVELRRFLHE